MPPYANSSGNFSSFFESSKPGGIALLYLISASTNRLSISLWSTGEFPTLPSNKLSILSRISSAEVTLILCSSRTLSSLKKSFLILSILSISLSGLMWLCHFLRCRPSNSLCMLEIDLDIIF